MKIRKAEDHEKKNYTGLYPLFGYVTVHATVAGIKTRYTVPVEYLGEGKGEPNYEAILPKGLHLGGGEGIHTVLGITQHDLLERLGYGLDECSESCDEGGNAKSDISA